MATSSDSSSPARGRALTIALVAILVAALGLVAWQLFGSKWRRWARQADQKEAAENLLAVEDADVNEVIEEEMRDADAKDAVRVANATLLIQRRRLSTVERALKDPRLDVRTVALRALATQPYFDKYLKDESYGVTKTVDAWVTDPKSRSRWHGITLASRIYPPNGEVPADVRAAVRAVIAPGTPASPIERQAAAYAIAGWSDCDAAPALIERAKTEEDVVTRLRLVQAAERLFGDKKCEGRVPEAAVREIVLAALDHKGDDGHAVALRMGASMVISRHPTWGIERAAALRAAVNDAGREEPERRQAFEALVSMKDPGTLASFERWFHHPDDAIRSSAVTAARSASSGLSEGAVESCLVGYLRNETLTSRSFSMVQAYEAIRHKAGEWVGLPERFRKRGAEVHAVGDVLGPLFDKGAVEGVTRQQVGDELWRWLAKSRGLSPEETAVAAKARDEFWAKARAKDVAGAKAVLDPLVAKNADLWAYERGWVLASS